MSVYSQDCMPVLQKMMPIGSSTGSDGVEEQCTSNQQNSYNMPPSLVREVSEQQLISVLGTLTEAPWIKCEPTELLDFEEQSDVSNPQPDGEVDTKPSKEQLNSSLQNEVSRSKALTNCPSKMGRPETSDLRLIKAFVKKNKITESGKSQLAVAKPVVLLKQLNFVNSIPGSGDSGSNKNSADTSDDCVVGMPLYDERNTSEEMFLVQDSVPLGCNSHCEPVVERNSQDYVSSDLQNVVLSQEQHSLVFREEHSNTCEPPDNVSAPMIEPEQTGHGGLKSALGNKWTHGVVAESYDGLLNASHEVTDGQTVSRSLARISDDLVTNKRLMLQNKETDIHDSIHQSVNEPTQISEYTSLDAFSESASMSSPVVPKKDRELRNGNRGCKASGKTADILEKHHGLALNDKSCTPEGIHPRRSSVQNSEEMFTDFVLRNDLAGAFVPGGSVQNRPRRDVVCLFLNKFRKAADHSLEERNAAATANQHKICVFITMKPVDRKIDERTGLSLSKSAESSITSESSMTGGGQPWAPGGGVNERSVAENVCSPAHGHSGCELEEAIHDVDQCIPAENEQEVDQHHHGMAVVPRCEDNESANINCETQEVTAESKHGRTDAKRKNIRDDSSQIIGKRTQEHQIPSVVCSDVSIHMPSERRRSTRLNSSNAHQGQSPPVDFNVRNSKSVMDDKRTKCLRENLVETPSMNPDGLEEAANLNISRKRRSSDTVKTVKRLRTCSPKKQDVSSHDNGLSPRGRGAKFRENVSPVSCHSPVRKHGRTSPRLSFPEINIVNNGFCTSRENASKVKEQSQVMSVTSHERQRTPKKNLDVGRQGTGKCRSSAKQTKRVSKLPVRVVEKRASLFEGTTENSNSTKPSVKLMPNINASCDPRRAVMEELCVVSSLPCIQKVILKEVGHPKTVFQCSICPFTKKRSADVMTHMSEEHSKDIHLAVCIGPEQTLPLHIGCRHCDFVAMNKLTLLNHFTTYHRVSGLKPSYITVTMDLDGGYSARVKYKCAACEFMANIRLDLEEHWFTRHLKRSLLLICGRCPLFHTHSIRLLVSHVRQHNALPVLTCTATVTEMDGTEVREITNRKDQ